MLLLVDGRAFSLQQKGGVSQIWAKIVASQNFLNAFDVCLFLYPRYLKNIHLKESGLLENGAVIKIISDIPPTDNVHYDTAVSAEHRRALVKKRLAGRMPEAVLNTYYGENIFPDCTRYLVVLHDFAHEDLPVLSQKPSTAGVIQRKVQSMEKASDVIYISGFTRARAFVLYPHIKSRRDAIIFHGHEQFGARPDRISGKFIHIGTRSGYKNFGIVAGAFETQLAVHSNISLSIRGGEPADQRINKLIENFPERVTFATDVSDEHIFGEIASSEFFISASEYEGFGIPILNALHLGTHPILSRIRPFQEIASHFGSYFAPDSQKELEELIGRAAKSPPLMKPNAFRSWDRVARDYVDFIKDR